MIYRILQRSLIVLSIALAVAPHDAPAQNAVNYCAPSAAVKDELKQLPRWSDEIPYKLYQARRLAVWEKLVQKYPADFHVLKGYAEARRYDDKIDRKELINQYRALMEKNPNDPAAAYIYASTLVGDNTKEAIAVLDKAIRQTPEFPWSYLELGTIYTYPAFRDTAKSRENLKKWATKCPDALDSSRILAGSGDQEIMRDLLRRLRARLAAPSGPEDLHYYNEVWSLEFKMRPVTEHAQVRQQVADELKQLRAQNLGSKEWLQVLQEGYKVAADKEGQRWVQDEMLRLFPKSSAALRILRQRWDDDHPRPKHDESAEKKRAYNQALIKAIEEWLKQWPDDLGLWSARYFATEELENSSNVEFEATAQRFLEVMAKNEGSIFYIPPVEVMIAQAYAKRNIATERIPALIEKGLRDLEQREKRNSVSDLFLREGDDDEFNNLKYTRWYSWPVQAEAYAKLKQPVKAREVLVQMAETLKKEKPSEKDKQSKKTGYLFKQVDYWQAVGKVAEVENRKLDALTSYQTALAFRPQRGDKDKSEKKDDLALTAERLWKELGGTEQGWQAYLARRESTRTLDVAEAHSWDERKQPLPEFALADLKGKKWGLADLKGKVTFINFWATWCGPCRDELPYVQKLHEQMKGRKDVLVLTMNIDAELGLVEPFTKENKYSFTVIPAVEYARDLNIYSIPRNWVIGADGMLQFEGIGFGSDGNEWIKKATEMIEKVQATQKVKESR